MPDPLELSAQYRAGCSIYSFFACFSTGDLVTAAPPDAPCQVNVGIGLDQKILRLVAVATTNLGVFVN